MIIRSRYDCPKTELPGILRKWITIREQSTWYGKRESKSTIWFCVQSFALDEWSRIWSERPMRVFLWIDLLLDVLLNSFWLIINSISDLLVRMLLDLVSFVISLWFEIRLPPRYTEASTKCKFQVVCTHFGTYLRISSSKACHEPIRLVGFTLGSQNSEPSFSVDTHAHKYNHLNLLLPTHQHLHDQPLTFSYPFSVVSLDEAIWWSSCPRLSLPNDSCYSAAWCPNIFKLEGIQTFGTLPHRVQDSKKPTK